MFICVYQRKVKLNADCREERGDHERADSPVLLRMSLGEGKIDR